MWTNFFEKSKNDSIQTQSCEFDLSELNQAIMTEELENKVIELQKQFEELANELKKKMNRKLKNIKM